MTDKQYAALNRAAFAAKKLETGQLTVLDPRDVELIESLVKDKDGYKQAAVTAKRSESQAQQDIDRCERVLAKLGYALTVLRCVNTVRRKVRRRSKSLRSGSTHDNHARLSTR